MNLIPSARATLVGLSPLVLLAALFVTGCRTPNADVSRRMASVIITNRSAEDIQGTIREVFTAHGYEPGRSDADELVFEKPGSLMNGLVYGDWYSGGVWERLRVYQRDLDDRRTIVECDGFMVQEHEDPLFSKEKRELKTQRGHFQKLLNQVAAELKNFPSTNSPPAAQ